MLIFNGQILEVGNIEIVKGGQYRIRHDDAGYILQNYNGERITVNYESGERLWITGKTNQQNTIQFIWGIRPVKD